jgi:UDP-N-acetylmuramyl tripeptide synthase
MAAPRTIASVWAAKTAAFASRRLGRGGGTAISGLVGLRLQPDLIADLAPQLDLGCVALTGTNGKTTTSRLVSEAARISGLQPLANASGSNLVRGLAATLAGAAGPDGRLHGTNRLGVFEVDEATLPLVLPLLEPRAVVFTNLFRDQLDRYGEVEAVADLWRRMLRSTQTDATLVLNADDPAVAGLGEGRDDVVYFGVDDASLGHRTLEHASDAIACRCGARLVHDVAFIGHVGHWRCEACGRKRPEPAFAARNVQLGDGRSLRFTLVTPGGAVEVTLPIGGLYNVYNALAAAAACHVLGIAPDALSAALADSSAAFGRQEAFEVEGRRVEMFLGKNPAGLNQVLQTLLLDPQRKVALFALNDGIADGRDISWVWDADFEVASRQFDVVYVSGTRAHDMALRLKYAGFDEAALHVVESLEDALNASIAATPQGACLTVVPTYTAMLTTRDLLARRTGREAFWK